MENMTELIGIIRKSDTQEVKCQIVLFQGKARLDIRLFVRAKDEFIPTRKGISLDLRMAGALKELINKAYNKAMGEKVIESEERAEKF